MAGRRIEGSFNQGWGIAIGVCLLTAACVTGAFLIHKRTFHPPTQAVTGAEGAAPAQSAAPANH
jgi:hypothetical protein